MRLLLAAVAALPLQWLHMVDATHGYAVRGNYPGYRLAVTSDAGRTWTDITPGNGTIHPSGSATIVGKTILFGTQRGPHTFAVERSDDGGRTWSMSQPFRDPHGLGVGAPGVVDALHLYVAVDQGAAAGSSGQSLWTSADGGRTWRFVSEASFSVQKPGQLPFGCDKDGFGFATPRLGWAGAYCAGGAPFLYRTDDGGRTWHRVSLPGLRSCECDVLPPQFFDSRHGVIAVNGSVSRVYWTADGGATWRGSTPTTMRGWPSDVVDEKTVWLQVAGEVLRTTDAGRTWQSAPLPFDARAYRVDGVDAVTAFAFGPSLLQTADGGRHWRGLPVYPSCPLLEPDTLHGGGNALVPSGSPSVVLCRYSSALAASTRVTGNAAILLADALDALPPLSRSISCPVSLDSVLATFHYRRPPARTVRIDLSGCSAATNGSLLRRATPGVLRQVEHLVPLEPASRACVAAQLGVSVRTQGENTTAWIGVTVQNRGAPCAAKRVPVTVSVPRSRLTMYANGRLDHGGTKLLVANWSNWCGRGAPSVVAQAGSAEAVTPVRPLPVCLKRGQPSRLSASR